MQPEEKNVRGIAICSNCRNATFELRIYACTNYRAHCLNCHEAWDGWEAEAGEGEGNERGEETVGGPGDEPPQLVPASEGSSRPGGIRRTDRATYQREYMRGYMKEYRLGMRRK